ncbi:MAG: hypothetical protein IJ087_21350 [Eggerthellaceae bacterium]|nr:hypothetical protein [Eggerthellaceae bacterium]
MSLTLYDLLVVGATCVLFALLVRLSGGCNLAREERHRQWALPLVAIAYGAVLVWRFDSIYRALVGLYEYAVARVPFIGLFDPHCIVVCVFNLLAMLAFIIGKRIALAIVNRTSESGQTSLLRPFYNIAYYYDRDESKWLLRMRYSELRGAVANMHKAAVVLALVLLALSLRFSESLAFANPFYPVFLPLILGEVRFYFEGLNAPEYRKLMGIDPDEAERVRDYLALQKAAADMFPTRFMESHLRNARQAKAVTSEEYLDMLKTSPVYEERLAGEYAGAVYAAMVEFFSGGKSEKPDEEGEGRVKGAVEKAEHAEEASAFFRDADFSETFRIEADQIQAMVKMLKRENVIFATPFFRDFREFFFFPVNRSLMQGDNVLVLDCQGDLGDAARRWVTSGLHAASSVQGLWNCGDLSDDSVAAALDVGLLSAFHLNDFAFLESRRAFLTNVGFVIILHPSSMVAVTQIGFSRLTHLMRDPSTITYAAFDMNVSGLVDTLSHAARAQFVEVSAMPNLSLLNCGIHWRAEGDDLHTTLFEDVSHYLGAGTELGAFSLRMGVESVEWSAHTAAPLKDIRWISNQYYRNITSYAELENSQSALEGALTMNCGLWNTPETEHGYYIVEDEFCNLLEMQRQYSTRASASSFVNVISGNYLLRDFMRFNERVFLNDARVLSLVVADFQRSLRNYLIELIAILLLHDVSTYEIALRLHLLGVDVEPEQVFAYCVGSKERPGKIDEYGLVPDGHGYACIGVKTVEITDEIDQEMTRVDYLYVYDGERRDELVHLTSYVRYAFYIAEDEVEKDRHLGSCLFGQVHQRYLPGQFITLQGKYYEVLSITPDSGMILRRAADHYERRVYYRQVKSYLLGCCREVVDDMAGEFHEGLAGVGEAMLRKRLISQGSDAVEITMLTADVEVRTLGYLHMVDYADIEGSSFVALDDDMVRPRRYVQKNVLRIVFRGADDAQLVTVAVLLNELMRTMYACDYEYISVVPALREPVSDYTELGLRGVVHPLEAFRGDDTVASPALYVIEDSIVDIGLVSSFERNAERFMAIVQRFLSWHESMLEKGPVLDRESRHFISAEQILGDVDRFSDSTPSAVQVPGEPAEGEFEAEFDEPVGELAEDELEATPEEEPIGSASDDGTGAEIEADAEAGTDAEDDADVEKDTEAETEADAEVEADAETEAGFEADAEVEADAEDVIGSETTTDADAEANPETDADADADTEVEAVAEDDASVDVEAEVVANARAGEESIAEGESIFSRPDGDELSEPAPDGQAGDQEEE